MISPRPQSFHSHCVDYYHSAGNLSRTPTKKGGFFLPRTSAGNCRQYTGNSPEKYRQNAIMAFFGKNNYFFRSRSPLPLRDKFPAVRYFRQLQTPNQGCDCANLNLMPVCVCLQFQYGQAYSNIDQQLKLL